MWFSKCYFRFKESCKLVEKENNETEKTFRECQDKHHQLNLSNIINATMLKIYIDESHYISKPDKRKKDNYKDYQIIKKLLIKKMNLLKI